MAGPKGRRSALSINWCRRQMDGVLREYPMERYVRDTRVHQILEGTNQIMRVIISRRMLMAGALEVIQ